MGKGGPPNIPLAIRQAGRLRNRPPAPEVEMACTDLNDRIAFDQVIDQMEYAHKPRSGKTRRAVAVAREICRGCPARELCLSTHGRDYELGVVAGFTDQERADRFGAA